MVETSMFAIAMEGMTDGKPHIERELTCYVQLRDLFDVTSLAKDSETHEQWRVRSESKKGNIRIRLTDDVEYTITAKEKTNRKFESIETEQIVTKEFFETIRRSFAYDGYLKTRYDIPILDTGRKWEVDVFKNHRGEPSLWIKLDYEFGVEETEMPEIPFEYADIIILDFDDSRQDVVDDLWDNIWMKIDEAT